MMHGIISGFLYKCFAISMGFHLESVKDVTLGGSLGCQCHNAARDWIGKSLELRVT